MNDLAIGHAVRSIRQHLRLRQRDVARRAGVSQQLVSLLERGGVGGLSVHAARAIAGAIGAELTITVRWRGSAIDVVRDARHAAIVAQVAAILEADGWVTAAEVTYSEYGERGSIDLLAFHPGTRTLLIVEVKTQIASVEETLRRHDEKLRLAAIVARKRFGWGAARGVRLLAIDDNRTARRRIAAHESIFGRAYPVRGRAARSWFASPSGGAGLLLFLPATNRVGGSQRRATIHRVRWSGASVATPAEGDETGPSTAELTRAPD